MFDLDATGPVPTDLGTRTLFEGVRVPMNLLIEALDARGEPLKGRRFVDCVIYGPCVVIPGNQTRFDSCNLGDTSGDIRNLFLQAVGPMIIGGIALNDCVFEGCLFIGVGYAGDGDFVEAFIASLTPAKV